MSWSTLTLLIGVAVLVGTMILVKRLKGDKHNKVKDGFILAGLGIAIILFIVGLFK
ncbi:MAG: hypothetical protein ABH835_04625 [Patescibacteria group bacterium]